MSPRTSTQFEEMREQSRNAILEAALKLFAEKGYHKASIAQIANEAGVSKGLIYNYFEKKDDLLMGMIEREMKVGESMIAEMMAIESPLDQFRFVITQAFKQIKDNAEHNKLLIGLSLHIDEFPFLKDIIIGKYEGSMPFFVPLLKAAGVKNPEAETRMLAALLDGIALQYHTLGDSFPIAQVEQDLLTKYGLNQ
ncbi:MAG: TetR/AcrR family transcriptional regulator [Bacteroidia bacterium]